jgi:hypothetical protein
VSKVKETTVKNDTLADDLLWSVEAIGREIGKTPRQTTHLIEAKIIPATKLGGRYIASRRKLREYFANVLDGHQVG